MIMHPDAGRPKRNDGNMRIPSTSVHYNKVLRFYGCSVRPDGMMLALLARLGSTELPSTVTSKPAREGPRTNIGDRRRVSPCGTRGNNSGEGVPWEFHNFRHYIQQYHHQLCRPNRMRFCASLINDEGRCKRGITRSYEMSFARLSSLNERDRCRPLLTTLETARRGVIPAVISRLHDAHSVWGGRMGPLLCIAAVIADDARRQVVLAH